VIENDVRHDCQEVLCDPGQRLAVHDIATHSSVDRRFWNPSLPLYHCQLVYWALSLLCSLQLALFIIIFSASLHIRSTAPLQTQKLTCSINPSHPSLPHLLRRISRIFMTISGLNCSSVILFCFFSSFFYFIRVIDLINF